MTDFTTTKVPNADSDGRVPLDEHGQPRHWCGHCGNEGVVMLEGSTIVGGVEYSRGSAPCPWCLQGALRYDGWTSPTATTKGQDRQGGKHVNHHRQLDPASGFTMFDVAETGREPRRADRFVPSAEWCRERAAAGCSRGSLWVALGHHRQTAWPPEWAAPGHAAITTDAPSEADEIRRKRELALRAKNQAEHEEGSP